MTRPPHVDIGTVETTIAALPDAPAGAMDAATFERLVEAVAARIAERDARQHRADAERRLGTDPRRA